MLSGGKARMVVRTWGSTVGSSISVEMKSDEGNPLSGAKLVIRTGGSGEGGNDTTIRNVVAGEYYLSVTGDAQWEAVIHQRK